ncbi:MAG: hypothetical protein WDA10_14910 [Porticoccaceae bacterium]|jgi:alkylhydroperoxidase family enzyme|nr:hypothetical protein [Porticoccaceae bacterium]MEA3300014.1 hypothetical protein [Pseudomonadota bacterium]HLS98105.1 hypothetical protein [Porticoccaceae bacterium]
MPYRVDIPEGQEALEHILNHLGTPMLVEARKRTFRIMYDAPETTLSPREREVMRYPLTAVMGCPICNSLRLWRDWPGFSEEPIEEELYSNAAEFNWTWPGFSPRESLALEFVHRFVHAIDDMNGDDAFWARMRTHFSDIEIGDICVMAGTWLGTGHALKALGIGSVCPMPVSEEMLSRLRNDRLNSAE